jgi:hypothetical protein
LITVETETGSLYEFDLEKKTWARVSEPRYEGMRPLRNKKGVFFEISEIVVGQSVRFTGPGFDEDLSTRYIHTSRVVRITEHAANQETV